MGRRISFYANVEICAHGTSPICPDDRRRPFYERRLEVRYVLYGSHRRGIGNIAFGPDDRYAMVKAAIHHQINTIYNSSMGRLFDAIAAACGIHDENRYEGECAIMLENAAARCEAQKEEAFPMTFLFWQEEGVYKISAATIFQAIAKGVKEGHLPNPWRWDFTMQWRG